MVVRRKRYWLEFCVVMGFLIPWVSPLIGLGILTPFVKLGLMQSNIITAATPIYGAGVIPWNLTSYYDYYFWNITNPLEVESQTLCWVILRRGSVSFFTVCQLGNTLSNTCTVDVHHTVLQHNIACPLAFQAQPPVLDLSSVLQVCPL